MVINTPQGTGISPYYYVATRKTKTRLTLHQKIAKKNKQLNVVNISKKKIPPQLSK